MYLLLVFKKFSEPKSPETETKQPEPPGFPELIILPPVCDLCCELEDMNSIGSHITQKITIRIIPRLLNEETSGYCINTKFLPDKNSSNYHYYKNNGQEDYINWMNKFELSPEFVFKEIIRLGRHDKINVTIGEHSEIIKLGCNRYGNFDINIKISREERYNCIFKGKIMSQNLSYAELNELTCDEYKTYCGT